MAENMNVLSSSSNEHPSIPVECKKGWIITLNENGNYTPFFVKVREEDLVWKVDDNNELFNGIQQKLDNADVKYDAYIVRPSPCLDVEAGNWHYEIKADKSFTASYTNTPIKGDWKTQTARVNGTDYLIGLETTIKLPIPISKENYFLIPTINPNLTSIIPSFTMGSPDKSDEYDRIILKISDSSISQNGNELQKLCNSIYQANISILLKGKIY